MKYVFALVAALLLTACSGDNQPSKRLATITVIVDGVTCPGSWGSAQIAIDGVTAGVTFPGSNGVTKDVSVGQHSVSGSFLLYLGYGWRPTSVYVPAAGYTQVFACHPNNPVLDKLSE